MVITGVLSFISVTSIIILLESTRLPSSLANIFI
uniref:Uncharacterized protein n=1 Tax=Anguilla anguilla TaxID=7936 RepID=A0A0E9R655_ANGAN